MREASEERRNSYILPKKNCFQQPKHAGHSGEMFAKRAFINRMVQRWRKDVHTFFCRQTKWSTCALSGQPLQPPLAADMLGSLYNREAVLEFLLGRAGHFADKDAEVCILSHGISISVESFHHQISFILRAATPHDSKT